MTLGHQAAVVLLGHLLGGLVCGRAGRRRRGTPALLGNRADLRARVEDELGRALGDHDRGRGRLAARDHRDGRRIAHAEARDTLDAQVLVHYGTHGASARDGVGRVRRAADVVIDLLIRDHVRPRVHLLATVGGEGSGGCQPTPELNALAQRGDIVLVVEVAAIDARAVLRIGAAQGHRTPALRAHGDALEAKTIRVLRALAEIGEGAHAVRAQGAGRKEAHLEVRLRELLLIRVVERTVVAASGREKTALREEPLQHRREVRDLRAEQAQLGRHGDAVVLLAHAVRDHRGRVVLQVLAHLRRIHDALNAVLGELLLRADAAEEQPVRGRDGTAAKEHLAPLLHIHLVGVAALIPEHDALRARAVLTLRDVHLLHLGARGHGEVRVLRLQHRLKVGRRAGAARAVSLRDLEAAGALLGPRPVVEVVVEGNAGLLGGLEEGARKHVLVAHFVHGPLAARAVVQRALLGAAGGVVLGLHEEGQDVLAGPAIHAPGVVVGGGAAVVQQHVGAGRAAEHLAAAEVDGAALAGLLALREVRPVHLRLEELEDAGRHLDLERVVIRATGLEHEHALAGAAQPVSEHAAREAAAADDVVILRRRSLLGRRLRTHQAAPEGEDGG
mmetsp:Transcript_21037/g.64094  ORF Transcript_21037/g.64094 Transcript_21037/m.64094 type:complete len:617 (+) Transcript_21037:426-2276(+)